MKKIILMLMVALSCVSYSKVYKTKYIIDKNLSKLLQKSNLDNKINNWLSKNKNIKLIDIKFSDNDEHPSVLIIYEEEK